MSEPRTTTDGPLPIAGMDLGDPAALKDRHLARDTPNYLRWLELQVRKAGVTAPEAWAATEPGAAQEGG
jgi:hypothetical protein